MISGRDPGAASSATAAPPTSDPPAAGELVEVLERRIAGYGAERAVVAFSGGVDSAVVAALAVRSLGPVRVTAVTAISPSYPSGELEQARTVAAEIGVAHRTVETSEVDRDDYARNDALRCFHCKSELYETLIRLVEPGTGPAAATAILAGANADDRHDFRPGLRAAVRHGVHNPLLEAGIGKGSVRALARHLGLAVADRPALACLSSRVAFGVRLTPELLGRIDRAESLVRGLGFLAVRVRHWGDRATIEVEPGQVGELERHPDLSRIVAGIRALGWSAVEVERAGYRPGTMNATLVQLQRTNRGSSSRSRSGG